MKPREALNVFKAFAEDFQTRIDAKPFESTKPRAQEAIAEVTQAVEVLERLVSKDEADRRYADAHRPARVPPVVCTCATPALGPCAVWGHS